MHIFSDSPDSWSELECLVAAVFREMGCDTRLRHRLETVRGNVTVDVMAVTQTKPTVTYLCECKHWARRIPQTVIHSFRSVVADAGANVGIIISKKGFQSGAKRAAEKSNLLLLDWTEFQDMFCDRWWESRCAYLVEASKPLRDAVYFVEASVEDESIFYWPQLVGAAKSQEIFKTARELGALVEMTSGACVRSLREGLPFQLRLPPGGARQRQEVSCKSLSDLVVRLIEACTSGMRTFEECVAGTALESSDVVNALSTAPIEDKERFMQQLIRSKTENHTS